jgi:hypothetical protein
MTFVDQAGGVLMSLGCIFWAASVFYFLKRLGGIKPGARIFIPFLLYKRSDLNEAGVRSQSGYKFACIAYLSCFGMAAIAKIIATQY